MQLATSDQQINYTLRKSTRARRLRLVVYCDASVVVTAPVYFDERKIELFLREKTDWILSKISYFKKLGGVRQIGGGRREYKKYREKARAFILEKIEKINLQYDFSFNRVAIKNHRRRWGSCSSKRNLNFNYKIIFLPEKFAEYIVAHELCHLREFNHSRAFWNLVERAAPDYRQIIKELKKWRF